MLKFSNPCRCTEDHCRCPQKICSSLGTTARALVLLTDSTSAHLVFLHTTTSRLAGPKYSMASSFQGSHGRGDILSGSRSCDSVTTWRGWQCLTYASTLWSRPGKQTVSLLSFKYKTDQFVPEGTGYRYPCSSHYQSPYHC